MVTRTPDPPRSGGSRVTIADIARELGISKAAVSYALTGRPGVGADTRERVLAAAETMGWYTLEQRARPHRCPRRRRRAGAVAAAGAARPSRPSSCTCWPGSRRCCNERGSSLLLRVIGDHPDEEIRTYRRWWGERRIDGVILLDERFRDPASRRSGRWPCRRCSAAVRCATGRCRALWTDHAADADRAVEHLHALGHWHVAHISGPTDFVHERARRRGVRRSAARRE